MNNETLKALGIELTEEKVLDAIASHFVEQLEDYDEGIRQKASAELKRQVDIKVQSAVESALAEEMSRILSTIIAPVDIWGDRTGEPKALREMLADKSKNYWQQEVREKSGEPVNGYCNENKITRAEFMCGVHIKKIAMDNIRSALKPQIDAIFDVISEQSSSAIRERLDKLAPKVVA